jgi:hypothetical protein
MSDHNEQTNDGAAASAGIDPFAASVSSFALLFGAGLLSALPDNDRDRFDRLLAQRKKDEAMDLLCAYAINELRAAWSGLLEASAKETFANMLARFAGVQQGFIREVQKTGAEPFRKCGQAKKEKTAKRHALIDQAIGAGMNPDSAQQIYEFIRSEDAKLLFRSKKSKSPDLDPKMMMLMYRRSKRRGNECNGSERLQ